jgi:bacterial/archaeal transporter family protein
VSSTLLSALLGVCGMFGWGVYDYLGAALSKRMGSFAPLFWSQTAGAATIVLAALAVRSSWGVPIKSLLLVPVAAGLYCGGYLFFFTGFEKGNVSIVAATMNLWAVVTMVVAFVFVGQRLTATQTLGALTIIAGATLASIDWTQVRSQGFQVSRGVKETLLGSFFFGVYWNVSEVVSEEIGWLRTTVLVKLGVVAVLLTFALLTRRQIHSRALNTNGRGLGRDGRHRSLRRRGGELRTPDRRGNSCHPHRVRPVSPDPPNEFVWFGWRDRAGAA